MHSLKGSLLKRWYSFKANPKVAAKKWGHQYWKDEGGYRVIACKTCPSFSQQQQQCSINFGSPLRKCVVSSIEAHLHNCNNQEVLEIGFGRFMLAKNLIRRSGGRWTGIEPQIAKGVLPKLGEGGFGHATYIPFPEHTFHKVFAVQSIEHWAQRAGGVRELSDYSDCIAEIYRVLKPGGTIYFDAPIHFHGNEMFIMGDLEKVRSYFPMEQWKNVQIEKWREQCAPLEPYLPPPSASKDWSTEIVNYSAQQTDDSLSNATVWMMAITAEKRL